MKKFLFSLQPLLKVKGIREKQKTSELADIQRQLDELLGKQADMNKQMDDDSALCAGEMRKGASPARLAWHANYADYLQTQLRALVIRISEAEREQERRQIELLSLKKEITTIEKLREKQYRAYLDEARKEEEKILGDLISYKKSTEPAG